MSERRAEHLLEEILLAQGWKLARPPKGHLLQQQEYRSHSHLAEVLKEASKSGEGPGLPEAILVDRSSIAPLAVIEAKADRSNLNQAVHEATEDYGRPFVDEGYNPLAIGVAGASESQFDIRVLKWDGDEWVTVTYEGNPINWIPNREDLDRITVPSGPSELRPTVPPADVLADRADEINRLLREAGIYDQFRPAVVGAVMLALWSSQGNLRKDKQHLLSDINQACERAFWRAGKPELAEVLEVEEANEELAIKAGRIVDILERLNVTVLTAEHDYLGQLYEEFFQYTGGNTIGQYFTPRHITKMMADLCEVTSNDVVLDPACGTGGFLIAAMHRVLERENLSRKQVVEVVRDRLLGFEKEPITAALGVANMILRGDGSSGVHRDDCFTSDQFPEGTATVSLMNPPFPHKKTDIPPEKFVERALEGLQVHGKLAVILPTSLLVKNDKGEWRESVLEKHSLLAVCQMPDELFEPYASSRTSVVLLEKGVPHDSSKKTVFVMLHYDGLTLKKGVRVPRPDGRDQVSDATDAILNKQTNPGFSGLAGVEKRDEWAVGAYIPAAPAGDDEIKASVDPLLRRLGSFYVRYAEEVVRQRHAVDVGDLQVVPYRDQMTKQRLTNAKNLPSKPGTIGGMFDVVYGMKELHSREGIPDGDSLIISPTEEYNGCYGWLEFEPLLKPPFVTAAQTGNIGESFLQLEPCAVNDDCLVLMPKENEDFSLAELVIAAAAIRLERWRFNYGRKLTPSRICDFVVPTTPDLERWVADRIDRIKGIVEEALSAYGHAEPMVRFDAYEGSRGPEEGHIDLGMETEE